MWVSRWMSGESRCERSPSPVSVGVNTSCPSRAKSRATRRQHHAPCQAPCTRTKVAKGILLAATSPDYTSERPLAAAQLPPPSPDYTSERPRPPSRSSPFQGEEAVCGCTRFENAPRLRLALLSP